MFFPALVCKNPNCSRPMLLPEPTRPDMSPDRPRWPTDGQPRNFLCPACRRASEYSLQDIQQFRPDREALQLSPIRGNVVLAEIECAQPSCRFLLQLRTLVPTKSNIYTEAMRLLSRWSAREIRCSGGHTLTGDFGTLEEWVRKMQAKLDPD